MRFKFISVMMVCVMALTCASCAVNPADNNFHTGAEDPVIEAPDSGADDNTLEVIKSGASLDEQSRLARVKSEYLIENNGYSAEDEIVAILSLEGNSIVENYLGNDWATENSSLAEYAASADGVRQTEFLTENQNRILERLANSGLITSVEYKYNTVANAVAVKTTYSAFSAIEELPYIKGASIAETYNYPMAAVGEDTSAIVNAVDVYPTGIYNASAVDQTGKGTAVAILDSGFDCSHSVFDIQPEGELVLDREAIETALSNDNLRAKQFTTNLDYNDVHFSDKIPFVYDYAGKDPSVFPGDSEHGTHVAGIIGGLDEERGHIGIAPDAQLVLLKVFPDVGEGAETDDILAALEDAVILGVDAINMSLGSSCGFARATDEDATNEIYDNIEKAGISLITAASNSYSSGFGGAQGNTNFVTNPDSGTVGSPSTYSAALSVASISGVKSKYVIGNGEQVFFYDESNSIAGEPNDFFAEIFSDVQTKGARYEFAENAHPNRYDGVEIAEDGTLTLEYVTIPGVGRRVNYQGLNVEGKVALVRRGDNTFEDKALQAKNAGAIACIIYNNIDGDILMSMGKTDHIPTISISKDDGDILASKSTGTLYLDIGNEAGPFMSDFSSWGPMPDLQLKPEITAHGGEIRSSVPGNTFAELSGTSMASPNLCGIVILIRQYLKDKYPGKGAVEISNLTNQLLMSTAGIILNEEGVPYSPRKQGAGLASIGSVVNSKAYLTVDDKDGNVKNRSKIELFDDPTRSGKYEMTVNVVNMEETSVSYELSLVGMTESVSTSDSRHVSETGQPLSDGFTATATGDGSISADNIVTVNGNGTLKVKIVYTLTDEDKNIIETLFPYGMYVEGFVKFKAVDDNDGNDKNDVDLNAPFLAFYGDWTQAPMFDKTYYEVESEAHNGSIDEEDKIKADYYATTPYGTYALNYIIPLGTYIYDVDTMAFDEIPASESHIAISDIEYGNNTPITINGISTVYAGLLRNAKYVYYTITDKNTGEVKYTKLAENLHKAFSQGGSPIPNYEELKIYGNEIGLVNNGEYEFKMVALLDYNLEYDEEGNVTGGGGMDTNIRNTFSFDFHLDNEAPIIKSAKYEKEYDRNRREDRYYVTLTVYDNQYVQSVAPIAFISDSTYTYITDTPIPVYSEQGKDNTVRIEITEYLKNLKYDQMLTSGIGFAVDDYALNTNLFICRLPGTEIDADGGFKFTTNGNYNENTRSTVNITVDQVLDLTKYLASTDNSYVENTKDPTQNSNKDFLKNLVWTSSNPRVATVTDGQVMGLASGMARITVAENYYGRTANIMVRVNPKTSSASAAPASGIMTVAAQETDDRTTGRLEGLRFSYFDTIFAHDRSGEVSDIGETGGREYITATGSSFSMYPGERIQLAFDVEPWYVKDNYTFTFSSTNPRAVQVDSVTGLVTAIDEGSATITLSASGSVISATVDINVKSPFVIDEARTLVAYKGVSEVVEIPDDEGILYIGPFAFSLFTYDEDIEITDDDFYANRIAGVNRYVRKVIIPEGVQEIQQGAFMNCTALEEVVLPKSIRFIRQDAFMGDEKLTTINLYENDNGLDIGDDNCLWVEAIGDYAFFGCSELVNIDLSKVYYIGNDAFDGCSSLASADLTSLRNTGVYAFADCTSLQSVTFDPDGKTVLSEGMFMGAGLTSVDIYEKKIVPAYCFAECESLATVNFHNGLLLIDEAAFYGCKQLTELTLPEGELNISAMAFTNCAELATIHFGQTTKANLVSSVIEYTEGTSILGTAFGGSKIVTFDLPAENTNYKLSADNKLLLDGTGKTVILAATGNSFGEYTLPAEYEKIENGAFGGADITKLTIENPDLVIGDFAFAECAALQSVVFPATAGKLSIGKYAFSTILRATVSTLSELVNFENVKAVDDYAFSRTALVTVKVGESAVLGEGVFFRCSKLISAELGANVTLGLGAFQSCENLQTVTMPAAGGVTFGVACFSNDEKLETIDLSTMKVIPSDCFYGCTALTKAVLSEATEIQEYAFADCSGLVNVTFPKVETIGDYAFSGDILNILAALLQGGSASLTDTGSPIINVIEIPSTLTSLGEGAFAGCWRLTSVTFAADSKLTEIPSLAFGFCASLDSVVLPDSVRTIGDYAFVSASELTSINVGKVEVFGDYAIAMASSLERLDLSSAKEIGIAAFASSTYLAGSVNAPNLASVGSFAFQETRISAVNAPNLTMIGSGAFQGTALTEFVFSDKLEKVGSYAFAECKDLKNYYFGSQKATDGKINDYALLKDGVLYTVMANGKLQLTSVPGGKEISVLEVAEGTYRIELYAGSGNDNIVTVVLPDSLRTIGNYAFYGYDGLKTVEFRSAVAPVLENYTENTSLPESAPAYDILHNQVDLFGFELCYNNFVDLLGAHAPLNMILPSNSDISGYDSTVYEVYFGKVSAAQRSSYVAMEKALRDFVEYAGEVVALGDNVTINNEKLVLNAATSMNAVKQDYHDFGISEDEWKTYTDAVTAAAAKIRSFKLQYASKDARDVQARIDALPNVFDGSDAQRNTYTELNRAYNLLTRSDRDAVDTTRLTAFRASIDAYDSGSQTPNPPEDNPSNPDDPATPPAAGNCSGCGSTGIDGAATYGGLTVLGIGILFAVSALVRRKRR